MDAIRAVVKHGRVEVDAPPNWPDGTPVRIERGSKGHTEFDDERRETPEEIQAWLHWYRNLQPLVFTPEEDATWEADRKTSHGAHKEQRLERPART